MPKVNTQGPVVLLTKAAVVYYALTCGHVDPGVADAMADLAQTESRFDTSVISKPNHDGSRDFGLYQINEKNLKALGLTYETVMEPCEASRAAATWYCVFSVYNTGNCHDGFMNGYVQRVVAAHHGQVPTPPPSITTHALSPAPVVPMTLANQFPAFGRKP